MYAMASAGGKDEEPGLFVKQGSKLHAKMLSKEAAAQLAVPSFRVYYPVSSAGAVPFLWESQPGTPKNGSPSAAALPPLTPPPSYYSAGAGRGGGRKKRRPGLIGAILPCRITLFRSTGGGRTAPCSSSSLSWSSSSSSSYASSSMSPVFAVHSSPARGSGGGGHHRRALSAGGGDGDEDAEELAAAPRCFWPTEQDCCCERGRGVVVKGCGVAVAVRNALATVVGGGKPGRRDRDTTAAGATPA